MNDVLGPPRRGQARSILPDGHPVSTPNLDSAILSCSSHPQQPNALSALLIFTINHFSIMAEDVPWEGMAWVPRSLEQGADSWLLSHTGWQQSSCWAIRQVVEWMTLPNPLIDVPLSP